MTVRNFTYFLKQASKSIIHNRLMSITSIITVFSSVLILSLAFTIGINITSFIDNIQDSFSFTAFINKDVTPDEIKEKYDYFGTVLNVKEVTYTSPDDALVEFAESLGDESNIDIINGLEKDNPLPASFTIFVENTEDTSGVVSILESEVGEDKIFSSVKHAQAQLEVLITVKQAVTIVSIALVSILGFIAIVIIMNTIKIAVTSRRTEISIMKYIGATDWFIRWPFLFEGIFIGLIGSFLAVVVTVIIYGQSVKWIEDMISYVIGGLEFLPPMQVAFDILPIALLAGISLGAIGSLTSLRSHLRV